MPGDSLEKKNQDTIQYQLQSIDSIKGDRPIVLYNYLQKDENPKLFNLPIEVLFTSILIPLIAFFLGLMISWIRERWKATSSGKANEKYFMRWASVIAKNVKRQAEIIKEFANDLLDIDKKLYYKTFNFHIDKIKEIAAVELYRALVLMKVGDKENQNTLYHKSLNALDFFQRKYSECLAGVEKINEQGIVFNKEWSSGLQELNRLRLNFITEKNRNLDGDYFLINLYNIHEAMKEKPETKSMLFNYYIIPIDKLCNEFLNSTPDDKRVLEIVRINSKLAASYKTEESSRRISSAQFIERNEQLEKSLTEFIETCFSIEKTKFRMI